MFFLTFDIVLLFWDFYLDLLNWLFDLGGDLALSVLDAGSVIRIGLYSEAGFTSPLSTALVYFVQTDFITLSTYFSCLFFESLYFSSYFL